MNADKILKCILVEENINILIKISLQFVPTVPIDKDQPCFSSTQNPDTTNHKPS